jgi:hypothetical protein
LPVSAVGIGIFGCKELSDPKEIENLKKGNGEINSLFKKNKLKEISCN